MEAVNGDVYAASCFECRSDGFRNGRAWHASLWWFLRLSVFRGGMVETRLCLLGLEEASEVLGLDLTVVVKRRFTVGFPMVVMRKGED